MTNPVVDVIAEPGEPGAETGVLVPVYPASGKADVHTWQLRRLVAIGAGAHPGTRLRRSARRRACATTLGLIDRTTAFNEIHRPPTLELRQGGRASAHVRRVPADAGRARRRASARSSVTGGGIEHLIDGPLVHGVPRSAAVRAHERAATRDRRHRARPRRRRHRCTGCSRAKSVRARRSSRSLRCSSRCKAGTRARSWRRPKCWPSSTTSPCAPCSTASPSRRREACSGNGRCASSCSRTEPARPSAAGSRKGFASGDVDLVVGTHALIYEGVEFADLGVAVIDEQHRFGVEQRDLLRTTRGDDGPSPMCW